MALGHHQAGRIAQATAAYRQVLTADPAHTQSLHHLGVLALQAGQAKEAHDLIGRAIALEPGNPESHNDAAIALWALGRADEAAAHLRRAIGLQPSFAAALVNLGKLALAAGRAGEAVTHFQAAIRANPHAFEAYFLLARTLLWFGKTYEAFGVINGMFELGVAEPRAAEALALIRLALETEDSVDSRTLFVQCVRSLPAVPDGPGIRGLMLRALSEPWGRPADLSAAAISLIRQDQAVAACLARAAATAPCRLPGVDLLGEMRPIMQDGLLRALLESACIRDIGLERALTGLRAALLDAAPDDDELLSFGCALACQSFINEYAFDCTAAESQKVGALRDMLAAGTSIAPLKIAILGAYEPLHTLPNAESLLAASWPAAVTALLDLQVRAQLEEKRIAATIPALTPITDAVSQQVRAQYEQNPYPRWIKTAPAGRAMTIDARLARYASFQATGVAEPKLLIAGCGTGQHVASVAAQFTGLEILAIDLSRASLAYAQRMTRALGLTGIAYAQADILALGALGRSFDCIDASGVLHHLADPLAGWRELLSLLRPGGVMRLGLYSALGRRDVVAVRRFVAESGYAADAEGIRKCRQELMRFAPGTMQHAVTETSDFFSISECRDLLFHVQEHDLTLRQIADFLAAGDARFLGFEGCARGYARYAQLYPDDAAMADLSRWERIENEDPRLFRAMYQFWVQKPR